jgi:hypothetical protein
MRKGIILLAALAMLALPVAATAGTSDAKLSALALRSINPTSTFEHCPADAAQDSGANRAPACVRAALAFTNGNFAVLKYLHKRIVNGSIRGGTKCGDATEKLMKTRGVDILTGDWLQWAATKKQVLAAQIKFIGALVKVYQTC